MGINKPIIDIYEDLYTKGFFNNIKRVIELGSQNIVLTDRKELVEFLNRRNIPLTNIDEAYEEVGGMRVKEVFTNSLILPAKYLYKWLGVENYHCIDMNGDNYAYRFNLDYDLFTHYFFTETADLITNFGTTEHIMNQYTCFKNIHNMTKPGGYMFHSLQMNNILNHGFFQYNQIFFKDLALANDYTIERMWLGFDNVPYTLVDVTDEVKDIDFNYVSPKYHNEFKFNSKVSIFVLFKKNKSYQFKEPIQELYTKVKFFDIVKRNLNIRI